jgi:hypothetical protein
MTVSEMIEITNTINLAVEAIESGGDFEKRRWNPSYDWQAMNDALRALKRLRNDDESTIE